MVTFLMDVWKILHMMSFFGLIDCHLYFSYDVVWGVVGLLHGVSAEFYTHHRTETLRLLQLLQIPVR
jgi:hypothetical protein